MSTIKSSAENLTLNADGSGNDIILQSNGSTKAIVTAEGNVGIGITPDAWGSSIQAIQVGDYGSINEDTASKTFDIRCNSYQSASADVHTNTDEATMFRQGGGKFHFYQAVSASADASVSWTEPLRIDTTGDIQVKTGDIVFGTAGKGICLGVTTNTDANTLSDYEEGTWTVTVKDDGDNACGIAEPTAYYTKIGNVVKATCTIRIDDVTGVTTSNGATIGGLPFTATSTEGKKAIGSLHIQRASFNDMPVPRLTGGTSFDIQDMPNNTGVYNVPLLISEMDANSSTVTRIDITYFV